MASRNRFLVGFVAVVLLVELAVRVAAPRLPEPLQWYSTFAQVKAGQLAGLEANGKAPAVVFIGSSSVATAFDPAVFREVDPCGRTAYNAALTGASPQINEMWLPDAVLAHTQPTTVVIGLASRDMTPDQDISSYQNQLATRTDPLAELDRRAADVSAMVRYRSVLREPRRWFASGADDSPEIDPDGFDRRRGHDPYKIGDYGPGRFDPFEISSDERAALERTLADLRERGIDVVIADMAVSVDYVHAHAGGQEDLDRFHQEIERIAREGGATFVDLTGAASAITEFSDPIHVNAEGSGRVTRALVAQIESDSC